MSPLLLVALDIDGTLIDLAGAGSRAMHIAFEEVLGLTTPPQVSFAGSTDREIVTSVFADLAGHEGRPTEADLERFWTCYLSHLPREIARTPYRPTPGAAELVARLRQCAAAVVGLATGNVEQAARLKLESAGLGWGFDFGAYGCEVSDRAELVARAFERAEAGTARHRPLRRVVVGDTPKDIDAARSNGALTIAVATGPFSLKALREHGPDLAVETLEHALSPDLWRSFVGVQPSE